MDEELVKLFEFDWDIQNESIPSFPEDKLEELKSKKFSKVKIVVFGNPDSAAAQSEVNYELYSEIKKVQGLPGEVVLKFLNSKGSILSNEFKSRVNF